MKITAVEAIPITIPQDQPFTTHRETMTARDYVIVKVHTDEGVTGIAEASTIDTWGEPQMACAHALESILGPAIRGIDPFAVRRVLEAMDIALEGFWYSKASIDIALYDIMGKALDVPVYKLLGGEGERPIRISRSVGITDVDQAVDWAGMLVDELGSTTIKIKVGIDHKADIEIVKRIRQLVGSEALIKVDANQGFGEAKQAIRTLRAMEEFDVAVAEQPVKTHDLKGMAAVTEAITSYVAADESVWNARDVLRIHEMKAADVLTIYLVKAGGITRNLELSAIAEACGLPCILGGMGEMGLGSAANLHFAAASRNLLFPGDIHIPPFLLTDDILAEPIDFQGDLVSVPTGPGLGVKLDEGKLEKYRTRGQ